MSTIRIRNEEELSNAGLQLDPTTGELATIPQGVVWEMTDDQFAAFAVSFSSTQCAAMIREALEQGLRCLKRGAEWYYAAGRWLSWVKEKQLYGIEGWESFCEDHCKVSPSQAWKYREFAQRFTPQEIRSFGDERFSLERALGYAPKQSTEAPPSSTRKKATKAVMASQDDVAEDSEENADDDDGPRSPSDDKPDVAEEEPTQKEYERQFAEDGTKTAVKFLHPGHFELRVEDGDSVCRLHLSRRHIDTLYWQFDKAMDKDDACKPDELP